MIISKEAVVRALEGRRRYTEARVAGRDLPDHVDTERDRAQLALLGIDPELSDTGTAARIGDSSGQAA